MIESEHPFARAIAPDFRLFLYEPIKRDVNDINFNRAQRPMASRYQEKESDS